MTMNGTDRSSCPYRDQAAQPWVGPHRGEPVRQPTSIPYLPLLTLRLP